MIVDIPSTTTGEVNKRLVEIRKTGGAVTLGRVLTLVVCTRDSENTEDIIDSANEASREHPCRVIVLARGDRSASPRLDAQIRVGGDAGASEVVVLRLYGELADHESSVVVPFLLPDTPVVAWWPEEAPEVPALDPVGRLAIRRITDATGRADPRREIRSRLAHYSAGDTDLAWSRITSWRALLTSSLDQPPYARIESATVSGLVDEPAVDMIAGWLASRVDVPVRRLDGPLFVELTFAGGGSLTLSRPQTAVTATLARTGHPDALVSLGRRATRDCLAEELRRLDGDEIYHDALAGLEKVAYE
ncbi:glucose-6-phosphate dehydrogenase assembly protein OpcA [Rhodococcus triatomae]|uniref:Glucose-6-phosphate dehydrogenase assembly protein OpcA n=1 Tax=Rhodococcus triatomae TaxID=300028 RepID=A0A1G8KCU4_9NOCA|nr:glucose-6-phosphate dehydrogenase assembly protein OpcA [Rhodococcus triatomae]QNG18886.1 glucose-6-phosphate dehydrogenase assembly protein OpcA [Rhodococcus triatomae]QNG25202.1 glucose-6-phosphate dehydrogenase assembly protein OpcA [Rhodococcus triatomae]SDI41231.1 glucose-6-phosphate dehydrogenase assembly protein OpcA [Rhodococcus triatomae]